MTPNSQSRSATWQLLHVLTRLLGLTGLAAGAVGLVLWFALNLPDLGMIVAGAGGVAVAIAILAEARNLTEAVVSSRGAVGFNSALQIILACVLLVGVNYFSFANWHKRYDCTRERIFTLAPEIRDRLARLRGNTHIIVYLQHVSFGQRVEIRQDEYEQAAEKKIAEKVIDLKEQFEAVGPRFHVHILDTQHKAFKDRCKVINILSGDLSEKQLDANDHPSKENPITDSELLSKIKKAPENSIFFYAPESKELQRLSFSDVYHLDKKASEDANQGSGNLVLNYQGVGPFARKIFNIEEKTPRVMSAIIHPLLGMQNGEAERYTMNGAKKVLDTYSIGSTDLMLRKIEGEGELTEEPTALTYDESRYEQIEDELAELNESIPDIRKDLEENTEFLKFWTEKTMDELNKKYIYCYFADGRQNRVMLRTDVDAVKKSGIPHKFVDVDDDDRRNRTALHRQNVDVLKHVLERQEEEKKTLVKEKSGLKAEDLAEKRRFTDIEAKMKGMLASVDLLVIPRMTLVNAPRNFRIPNRIHKLDVAQLNAVKAYLKEGKPALFLLGSTSDPGDAGPRESQPDTVEAMLGELGFKMPKQTILYNIEAKEFNERKVGVFSRLEVEVPGLKLDDTTETALASRTKESFKPHPIRTSVRLMSRNISGKDAAEASKTAQEIRIRHPRPVYYVRTIMPPLEVGGLVAGLASPGMAGPIHGAASWISKAELKSDDSAVILVTREECWNEEHPFIAKNKVPRFTPTKDDDPTKGTVEEVRRGPFPIGVAIETTIPSDWYDKDPKPTKVRLAVIGNGQAFVGQSLAPLKEKLLLDTVNWLVGRDDLLARDSETWQYPRLAMKPDSLEYHLWWLGAFFGLPLFFLYVGTAVMIVRHMR